MKQTPRALLTVVILCGLLLALPPTWTSGLRATAVKLASPFLKAGSTTAIWFDTRYQNLTHLGSLYQERDQLSARVIELEQQVTALADASHENDLLRQELGARNGLGKLSLVQASIISRSSTDITGEVIIDQGSRADLKVGQAVVSQGMLVGKITALSPSSATVTLTVSPRAQIQAELVDTQSLGLVNGGPTGLHLTEIDQGVAIKSGEIVQTSGLSLDGTMPRGLVIGQVDRVVSAAGASHQEAIIHSPIDFEQLRLVFVVTGKQ